MKKPGTPRQKGKGGIELIEEATDLLRRASVDTLCCYYLGAVPFVFGVLYFWADMSGGAGAADRLVAESLWSALLFLWMKCWQAVFARRLMARLMNEPPAPLRFAGLAVVQGVIQPWSLLVMPSALLLTIPFGWCFAFFQNVTVLGPEAGGVRAAFRKARKQAGLWPGQNIVVIFFFFLFAAIVFANLCAGAFLFPRLLKSLLGVETVFTRSNIYLLNSTFWVSAAALSYLCTDPLLKAIYVLRCFYGESLETGADLLTEMRGIRRKAGSGLKPALLCVAACASLVAHPAPASASDIAGTSTNTAAVSVDARELDRSIEQVINSPEFSWRLPREETHATDRQIPGFIRTAIKTLSDWTGQVGKWFEKFLQWLAERFLKDTRKESRAPATGLAQGHLFLLMFALFAVVSCAGVLMLRRLLRRGRREVDAGAAPEIRTEPDMSDDKTTADELPCERWAQLAAELFGRGEARLGLRALYFACLARLAEDNLLTIARFKSNRDYENELRRRAHSMPELIGSFSRAVLVFERTWYGSHPPRQDMVDGFTADYRRIAAGVGKK